MIGNNHEIQIGGYWV